MSSEKAAIENIKSISEMARPLQEAENRVGRFSKSSAKTENNWLNGAQRLLVHNIMASFP
jgi:hypothetical protein